MKKIEQRYQEGVSLFALAETVSMSAVRLLRRIRSYQRSNKAKT